MNINIIKALLSFLWFFPFFYIFCDIYFELNYYIPSWALRTLLAVSALSALILVLIWLREFRAIRFLNNAFLYLSNGNLVKLEKILSKTNIKNYVQNGKTLLQYAVDNQAEKETIVYLLSKKAYITFTEDKEYDISHTLFYLASYYNYLSTKMIKYLLQQGANPNFIDTSKGFDGLSLLQVLVLRANKNGIGLLLEQGADINYFVNDLSMNSLMLAAKYVEEPLIIKLLLEAGADVTTLNKDGYNALLFAAHHNQNPAILAILVNYGAKIKPYTVRSALLKYNEVTPLLIAATYNNAEVVKTIIRLGDNVNFKDSFSLTPLFVAAAQNEDVDVLKALINAGAIIDKARDLEGNTPLMAASYLNTNPNVIRYLIDKSHNLKSKNKDGMDFTAYLKQNNNLSEEEKRTILRWN